MDIGQNAFSWRVPGVLAGALMAGLLYLLARVLFRRRSVAVIAGLLVLADGMLFAQSRIAMNDAYVAFFIVAALTVFAPIWTGAWRWRGAFWVGLPLVGLLLGLALASKWVALYAIGGIALLILLRSALGRALIVVGLAAIAATLGYMAIATGPEATSGGNLTFLLLMIALTMVASAVAVLHPVAWTVEEVRIAVGGPAAAGALLGLASIPLGLGPVAQAAAVGLMAIGGAAAGAFWLAGRLGLGPLAPPPGPDDPAALLEPAEPAPVGWLRPGWLAGLPIAWAALCLLGIPVVVYVVSYLPWAALGNQIVTGWPAGHDGQTLLDLTRGDVRLPQQPAGDPRRVVAVVGLAGQPQAGLVLPGEPSPATPSRRSTTRGNLAAWWLSIPAIAFAAWQAFRRRSLALALVTIMFASLWLPWARIDRATFQYHYYTALPFVLLALAYFTAEIWHGPTRRTWRLARGAAAGALLAPVALWLFRGPLCALIDVERANPGSQACTQAASLPIGLTRAGRRSHRRHRRRRHRPRLAAPRAWTGPCAAARDPTRRVPPSSGSGSPSRARSRPSSPSPPSCRRRRSSRPGASRASSSPCSSSGSSGPWPGLPGARPRRAASRWASSWRPASCSCSSTRTSPACRSPSAVYNWYQGLLPTWLYPFQFPVNTDPAVTVSLLGPWPLLLFVAVLLAAGFVAYSAWVWRLALAERRAEEDGSDAETAAP